MNTLKFDNFIRSYKFLFSSEPIYDIFQYYYNRALEMHRALAKYELCMLICYTFMPETLMKLQTKIINNHSVINTVVDMIKSCHINEESSILVAGEFNANEIEKLTSSHQSVMIIDHFDLSDYINVQNTVQALVISPNSNNDLHGLLQQVKNSSMWNNLRYNIILSRTVSSRSCDKALRYLFTSWKGDLLNSIFLCALAENSIKVYTYNPYTDLAPKPWSFVTKFKDDNDYWYLYLINHYQGHLTCSTLFFDKSLYLNGYTGIKAVIYLPPAFNTTNIFVDYNHNIKKRFYISIIRILYTKLNISSVFLWNHQYSSFDQHGNPMGVEKYLVDGHYDMLINHRYLKYTKGLVQSTFTLGESGLTFVIEHRGHVSIFSQIANYFKPIVIVFAIIVLGITIAVLKLSVEESYDTAVLEVFRLFLNGPLLRAPINLSPRIYLSTIFIFIFIVQSILQSKILTFIMVPQSNDINTFTELAHHNEYIIHAKEGYQHLLPPNLAKQIVSENHYVNILNESKRVFITEESINMSFAKLRKLHMSKEVIAKHHIIQRTRKSWPLFRRVNSIYMRLFETGISYHEKKMAEFYVTRNHVDEHTHNHNSQTVLTLQHVEFAFRMLVVGFICSFLSFIIEIKAWNFVPIPHRIKNILRTYYK